MRVIVTAILLCLLLQACGSKGALVLPADKNDGQQSNSNKQK
jgi:predicted small lipoprotein YifL